MISVNKLLLQDKDAQHALELRENPVHLKNWS